MADGKAYTDELEKIRHPGLRKRIDELARDPRIPAGVLRVWAVALMRWRVGDRDRFGQPVGYPVPPSASIPGVSGERAIELIQGVDKVVHEHLPEFRPHNLRRFTVGYVPPPPAWAR